MKRRLASLLVALLLPTGIGWAQDPAHVLTTGDVHLRVTNRGYLGNLDPAAPGEPAGQWPGASGVEYLRSIVLAVGAVNPTATDPTQMRRVSFLREWGPASVEPTDRIYPSFDGAINGARFINDDGDYDRTDPLRPPKIDEEFLDGGDNDGDGLIDEDYAAVGSEMTSLVMRDDGPFSSNDDPSEPHVPLGLECRQLAWAYSTPGFRNFCVIDYTIVNRSGHTLDSLVVGWRVDLDAGPKGLTGYALNDRDLPQVPSGEFPWVVPSDDPRRQYPHDPSVAVNPDSALCPRVRLRVNGFSLGDESGGCPAAPGIATFLLVAQSTDPLGLMAPTQVGFRAYRSYRAGTPFSSGGEPGSDMERFRFMTSQENIDPSSGFITASPGSERGDYVSWCSVGPFRQVADGGSVQVTVAFAVAPGELQTESEYVSDYAAFRNGSMSGAELFARHAPLANALNIAAAYEGIHEPRFGYPETQPITEGGRDFHGRETGIKLPRGTPPAILVEDCTAAGRERREVIVTDRARSWFDFDCDYCTGVWDYTTRLGQFHKTWDTSRPPIVAVEAAPPSPPVAMAFSLKPTTLNLRSPGRWVTGFLEPAPPLTANQIDVGSVVLNGTVNVDPAGPTEIADHDGNGIDDLKVKFDRAAVEQTLSSGDAVPVTVSGRVNDQCFLGHDQIRVLDAVLSAPAAGSILSAGATATVRWDTPPGMQIESVALFSSLDDGATWSLDARGLANTGSCEWAVRNVATDLARVAVALVESSSDYEVASVLGVSGRFSIRGVTGVGAGAEVEFALHAVTPNPTHALRVSFSLTDSRPARLALYDVSGRQVISRDVGWLGLGRHTVSLGKEATLPAGVYVVRLTQGARSLTTRALLIQ
jgi:hypothetical protein